ncbi:MAG: hypothetical protein GY898_03975 [Proteobacteria bacterium]|nr:hypothetical protein [Pseudomonadota bacterium]
MRSLLTLTALLALVACNSDYGIELLPSGGEAFEPEGDDDDDEPEPEPEPEPDPDPCTPIDPSAVALVGGTGFATIQAADRRGS